MLKKEQLAQNQNNNHRLNDTLPFKWKTQHTSNIVSCLGLQEAHYVASHNVKIVSIVKQWSP